MTAKKKTKKMMDEQRKRVERAYYDTCSGIQISIWDMSGILEYGNRLLDNGATEDELRTSIRAYVETIRKN